MGVSKEWNIHSDNVHGATSLLYVGNVGNMQ